jgi:ABC-type transporter Mla subunit MlaD
MIRRPRRVRALLATLVVVAAALLGLVMANRIGARTSTRVDLTFTGAHHLSPRTAQLLDRLAPGYEVVLAVDRAGVDTRSYDAVVDMLHTMTRATPSLGLRAIDVGSASGRTHFQQLIAGLQERERPAIEAQRARFLESAARFEAAAGDLRDAQAELESLAQAVPATRADAGDIRNFFSQRAALASMLADQLAQIAAAVRTELEDTSAPLPDTATLRDRVVPELQKIDAQLSPVVSQLARFAVTQNMPESYKPRAAALGRTLGTARDQLAVEADALARFRRASVFRVATALEAGEALLVVGPPEAGLTGIPRTDLIPIAGLANLAPADVARRAEDLVAIALASLSSHQAPILVMLHAEADPFVLSTPIFEQFIDRNRLRGVDVVEWPLITEPDPPPLESLDPAGTRPVVYFVIAPNSAAPSPDGDEQHAGARRASTLGLTLASLIDDGASMIVSVNPSVFPTFGDADPVAAALAPLGRLPRTGAPLVFDQLGPQGAHRSLTAVDATGMTGDSPLNAAVAALPVRLLWPIAVDAADTPGVTTFPLLDVEGGEDRWLESQWIGLWQAASGGAAGTTVTFDQGRDARRDRYVLARAAQRDRGPSRRPQRVICIGSNGWALDRIAQERAMIDGRLVPTHPGNLELIDSAVFWLAGQDEMIARGASTSSSPTVGPIDPATLRLVQWLVIAGLPLAVLALGVLYRFARG